MCRYESSGRTCHRIQALLGVFEKMTTLAKILTAILAFSLAFIIVFGLAGISLEFYLPNVEKFNANPFSQAHWLQNWPGFVLAPIAGVFFAWYTVRTNFKAPAEPSTAAPAPGRLKRYLVPVLFLIFTTFLAYLAGTAVNYFIASPMPAQDMTQARYDAALADYHWRQRFVAPLAVLIGILVAVVAHRLIKTGKDSAI
jgi:hypothetical protein